MNDRPRYFSVNQAATRLQLDRAVIDQAIAAGELRLHRTTPDKKLIEPELRQWATSRGLQLVDPANVPGYAPQALLGYGGVVQCPACQSRTLTMQIEQHTPDARWEQRVAIRFTCDSGHETVLHLGAEKRRPTSPIYFVENGGAR